MKKYLFLTLCIVLCSSCVKQIEGVAERYKIYLYANAGFVMTETYNTKEMTEEEYNVEFKPTEGLEIYSDGSGSVEIKTFFHEGETLESFGGSSYVTISSNTNGSHSINYKDNDHPNYDDELATYSTNTAFPSEILYGGSDNNSGDGCPAAQAWLDKANADPNCFECSYCGILETYKCSNNQEGIKATQQIIDGLGISCN